ncbi:hypothetical protein [Lederbergia panacisoli]|uniref:hypothetical protein n=1 Tax=Lederbergia panacisoli TaxID=1255251 RepID=UPI00214B089C|nr:hypothetical protein [Lederbergia panacisoli]MCR2822261.1 hypothetical protein [Lederbergia panacisoli]
MKHYPTSNYDEKLLSIDERICALLKERKEISHNNPSFPSDELISNWAIKYNFYEDCLRAIFDTLRVEDSFKPRVKPERFRKLLTVLKSVEIKQRLYTVTAIRQYENASVVLLHIDWDGTRDLDAMQHHHFIELSLGEKYDCWMESGGGSEGHYTYSYNVSPPLPDDLSKMDIVFREYKEPFKEKPTGLEVVLHID